MSKQCSVIEHLAVEHPGTIKPALEANGYVVVSAPAASIREFREHAEQAALLVVMGGPIGVYDAPEYPFSLRGDRDHPGPIAAPHACSWNLPRIATDGGPRVDAKVYPGTAGVNWDGGRFQLTEEGRQHALGPCRGE